MSSQEAKVNAIMKMIKNLPDDMIIEIKGYWDHLCLKVLNMN